MSAWGFRPESGQSAAGANTIAARAKGFQPYYAFDGGGGMASKRNVIGLRSTKGRFLIFNFSKKSEYILLPPCLAKQPGHRNKDTNVLNTFGMKFVPVPTSLSWYASRIKKSHRIYLAFFLTRKNIVPSFAPILVDHDFVF